MKSLSDHSHSFVAIKRSENFVNFHAAEYRMMFQISLKQVPLVLGKFQVKIVLNNSLELSPSFEESWNL